MFALDDRPPPQLLAELTAVLDQLVELEPAALHAEDRAELVAGLAREGSRLHALRALLVHAADQAGDWVAVGATSCRSWLAQLTGVTVHDAREQLRVGAALARLRLVARAALDGDLSAGAVEVLATTAASDTLPFALRDEEVLLDQAMRLRLGQLGHAVAHWRRRAKAEAGEGRAPDPLERRSFRLGVASDGCGVGRVVLDPHGLDAVQRALAALSGPPEHGDTRPPDRRRADALVELCTAFLQGEVAGGRAATQLTVLVPVEQLVGGGRGRVAPGGAGARTEDCRPIGDDWLGQLLCNSPLRRVVVDTAGLPLDVGRAERFATPAIWHALVVRDGGCSHPWCDRPPGWCQAHHVTGDWDDPRTRTAADQMTLACARHHGLTHTGGWHVEIVDGHPVWFDPTGTPIHGPP